MAGRRLYLVAGGAGLFFAAHFQVFSASVGFDFD